VGKDETALYMVYKENNKQMKIQEAKENAKETLPELQDCKSLQKTRIEQHAKLHISDEDDIDVHFIFHRHLHICLNFIFE